MQLLLEIGERRFAVGELTLEFEPPRLELARLVARALQARAQRRERRALRLDADRDLLRVAGLGGMAFARGACAALQRIALALDAPARCSSSAAFAPRGGREPRAAAADIRLVARDVRADLGHLLDEPRDALGHLLRPGPDRFVRAAHVHEVVVQLIDPRVQFVAACLESHEAVRASR